LGNNQRNFQLYRFNGRENTAKSVREATVFDSHCRCVVALHNDVKRYPAPHTLHVTMHFPCIECPTLRLPNCPRALYGTTFYACSRYKNGRDTCWPTCTTSTWTPGIETKYVYRKLPTHDQSTWPFYTVIRDL